MPAPGDTAARFGGDEFAVLLEELHEGAHAEAMAERIRSALAAPIHVRGRQFTVRASIGLAAAEAEASHEELLRRADLAMYTAKRRGGDRVQEFAHEVLVQADDRADLAYPARLLAATSSSCTSSRSSPSRTNPSGRSRRSSVGAIPSGAAHARSVHRARGGDR